MKSEKNEKQRILLESGVQIASKTRVMPCLENECVCRTSGNEFKVTKIIFYTLIFTTHVAALICLILVSFDGGKVCDGKIVDIQLDLEAMRTEYDSSLRIIRYKLRYIENFIDRKLNLEKQENHEKTPHLEALYTSTEENKDSYLEPLSSNFITPEKMTVDTDIEHEHFENISIQNNRSNPQASELQPDDELCSQVMTSNAEDFPEYLRLCRESDVPSRRTKRSNMRGPVASHFKGGVPETYIRDGGSLLAPWYPDDKASAAFTLKYEFREGKGTVEVTEEGLYLIYAQVYYLTNEPLNTYVINVREKDAPAKPLAYCSSNAVVPEGGVTEVSCYTAVIRYLNATNQVFITQRDRNRRMILRDGHSFMGLIFLNSAAEPKRRRKNRD